MFTFWPHPESVEPQKRWLEGAFRGPEVPLPHKVGLSPAPDRGGLGFVWPSRKTPEDRVSATSPVTCPEAALLFQRLFLPVQSEPSTLPFVAVVPSYVVCRCCPEFALSPSHLPSVCIIWVTLGNQSARANIRVWNCKVGALGCNCIYLLNFQLSCGTREGKTERFSNGSRLMLKHTNCSAFASLHFFSPFLKLSITGLLSIVTLFCIKRVICFSISMCSSSNLG